MEREREIGQRNKRNTLMEIGGAFACIKWRSSASEMDTKICFERLLCQTWRRIWRRAVRRALSHRKNEQLSRLGTIVQVRSKSSFSIFVAWFFTCIVQVRSYSPG